MKVRIGVGGVPERAARPDRPDPGALVADVEAYGIDSVWFSDLASAPDALDPLVAVAHAAGVTTRLKLGMSVLVLPGRNPALVAAQLASLAALAPGRVLPVFGVRPARHSDRTMYPVPDGQRAAVFEEALEVVRALLTEPAVTRNGRFFPLEEASVAPRPARALDLWLSGRVPPALDRVGRLGDGWLGSNVLPAEAEACRARIARAADRAHRTIDDDHYGTYLTVVRPDTDGPALDALLTRLRQDRPDVPDPRTLLCWDWSDARDQLRRHVDAGLSKFVVRPAGPVTSRRAFLEEFTATLKPLESDA
ncbi:MULTISPECIES: TIGR03854 family LLM class F420-dependent oxidoreductase [Streptomyces]|uniref:TIGR03854 family LLM class F420-dependent oxidoreductase n=1 Tax=Streptomyces TaxID=1883 RepID=UPI001E3F412B|nr:MULTISPECIES: TIGR03854 family LLM class F420-dependent oxidoreductase [Streptomyces]UFQ17185.1 TIGR03854 family LLM class F420-dependent oxidoreductase [Streptomyces huasconensis]WCL86785.1 TIGR03854 family LLM class F420-dependent oxidoreductase [Streptomyces sp. JCM 35825]